MIILCWFNLQMFVEAGGQRDVLRITYKPGYQVMGYDRFLLLINHFVLSCLKYIIEDMLLISCEASKNAEFSSLCTVASRGVGGP